jgi:hypothetical protein
VTVELSKAPDVLPLRWSMVAQSLARPYRVTLPMVLLVVLVPLYIFIPELMQPATRHLPELALDRAVRLMPVWALVYGALYVFLILLPIFVVRQEAQIRRTVFAYLLIWITAYVFFVACSWPSSPMRSSSARIRETRFPRSIAASRRRLRCGSQDW